MRAVDNKFVLQHAFVIYVNSASSDYPAGRLFLWACESDAERAAWIAALQASMRQTRK